MYRLWRLAGHHSDGVRRAASGTTPSDRRPPHDPHSTTTCLAGVLAGAL